MTRITLLVFLTMLTSAAVAEDKKALFSSLKKLTQTNHAEAIYHLGMFYNNGIGTTKSPTEALALFKKSAESGYPLAHYKLGCYYSGQFGEVKGIELDDKLAFDHKLIAAKSGYSRAQYDIGGKYFKQKIYQEALFWIEKSAKQKHIPSISALVSIHLMDDKALQNISKAHKYLFLLSTLVPKNNQLTTKLSELESKLTEQELEASTHFVDNWVSEQSELTKLAYSGLSRVELLVKE